MGKEKNVKRKETKRKKGEKGKIIGMWDPEKMALAVEQ